MANNICTVCGAGISEDNKFCTTCGAPVQVTSGEGTSNPLVYDEAATSIPAVQLAPPPPVRQQDYQLQQQSIPKIAAEADFIPPKGSKYEPISTRGYLGIWLLMMIPFLNLLLLIVWACGGCRKITKRNFARAMLIAWIIAIVLGVVLTFVFKSTFNSYISPIIAPYINP